MMNVNARVRGAREAQGLEREPFGRWLTAQRDRGDWIDQLADAARKDPQFPKNGTPEDVRARLRAVMAEGDMFEAVDDAEADWLSSDDAGGTGRAPRAAGA